MAGKLTWEMKVEIRFADNLQTTEIASRFRVHEDTSKYLVGNSHKFYLPRSAREVVAVEGRKKRGESEPSIIGIYDESGHEVVRRDDPDHILVYPTTKNLRDIEELSLLLRYESAIAYPLIDKNFNIDVDFSVYLAEYLAALGCRRDEEALNSMTLKIYAPMGCTWNLDEHGLIAQLTGCRGLIADEYNVNIAGSTASMRFAPGPGNPESARISLSLPVSRTLEQSQYELDTLKKEFVDQPTEDCIVFCCDLTGSSDSTIEGRPSADLLRFRRIWIREDVGPFRMVKVIGDCALVVSGEESFRSRGLAEIIDLYKKTLALGLHLRGGFHYGKALPTGDTTSLMVGDRIGEEFLGDAINRGAKIGDFKNNKEGIIASAEFLKWLNSDVEFPPLWQHARFGSWEVDLYRVDTAFLKRASIESTSVTHVPVNRHFADRLIDRARDTGSRLIAGLDPEIDDFPVYLRNRVFTDPSDRTIEDVIVEFNDAIIEGTANHVAAFKPQAAFYEQYGDAGLRALQRTISHVRDLGIPIILDAKRNDVSHTASAYGRAWLAQTRPLTGSSNEWRVDAITINGYLGIDGINPFLEVDPSAGLFVLAKTSNPSAGEFQDLILRDQEHRIFEKMALLAQTWGKSTIGESGYSRIGLVVGATYPEASRRLREIAPSALFLMPGVGAQGAGLDSIAMGCDEHGFGAFAASSRSILYGFDVEQTIDEGMWRNCVVEAASKEARRIKEGIQRALDDD